MCSRWIRTREFGCGLVGSGTVQITFGWRRPVKAPPEINSAAGRWTLLVPGPGGRSVLDLPPQRITGKISYADQTSEGGGTNCTG